MSKNVELYLDLDNAENLSINSNESIKDMDFETEAEKNNRKSLQNALKSNNNEYAFEKINSKITSFCSKIQILQDYSLCLGSKLDNKQKGEDIEKIILETGDEITETFNLIEIVKNFEYTNRNQKIQNIKQANSLEDQCNKYKEKFDNLINEIQKQNLNLIKQARNSKRVSNFSDFSGEIHLNNNDTPIKNNNNQILFSPDKKYLENIEIKKKQNFAIKKASKKMERSLSKRLTSIKFNNQGEHENKDDSIEIFNIDNNYKKFSGGRNTDSKEFTNNIIRKKSSSNYHEMEKRVFIALEGRNQSFIRRYWIVILIIIILILIITYYYFCRSDK